jgi:hypothetical protein
LTLAESDDGGSDDDDDDISLKERNSGSCVGGDCICCKKQVSSKA